MTSDFCFRDIPSEGEKDGFQVYSVPTKENTRAWGEYTVCFTKKDESSLFLTVPNLLVHMDVTTSANCFSPGFLHFTPNPQHLLLASNLKTKRNYPLTHRYPDYPAEHPGKDYEEAPNTPYKDTSALQAG